MKKEVEILKQYAQADFSKRIYLFLQFPELREAFQEIERIRFCCPEGFAIFNCTAEQREVFWASIVPQLNHRDMAIEKI